jgi:hypothetical protein
MITLAPSLLVAAAGAYAGPARNAAEFVHHVGYWSHFDHRVGKSSWPLPDALGCAALAKWARKRRIITEEPREGDVFLHRSSPSRPFTHVGIIAAVDCMVVSPDGNVEYLCATIESARGARVVKRSRRFVPDNGDCFIRWPDLDQRALAA